MKILFHYGTSLRRYDGEKSFIVDYANYMRIVIGLRSTRLQYDVDYYETDYRRTWWNSHRVVWDAYGCKFFSYPAIPLSVPCYIVLNVRQMVIIIAEQIRRRITGNNYTTIPTRFIQNVIGNI